MTNRYGYDRAGYQRLQAYGRVKGIASVAQSNWAMRRYGRLRGYGNRRRFTNRRGYTRTIGNYGRTGGTELKYLDQEESLNTIALAGELIAGGNNIAQGVGINQRVGRRCTIKGFHMRGFFRLPESSVVGNSSDIIRVIVVVDTQCNGLDPVLSDILEHAHLTAFYNLEHRHRFKILYDKHVSLVSKAGKGENAAAGNWGQVSKYFEINIANISVPIIYSSTTGAVAEIRSNNIAVFGITEKGFAQIKYHTRTMFVG